MSVPTKRALLIACSWGNLHGPEDDVQRVADFLTGHGFQITTCCGPQATQEGIRAAWKTLIRNISHPDDGVVIYYSGHGGEVFDKKSGRYHFIVPVDFSAGDVVSKDFRGIFDVELSSLLNQTTEATHNVTVILDCCHSGRMARNPHHGTKAVPKNINRIHAKMAEHIALLRRQGHIPQKDAQSLANTNPYLVRISAAAPSETAWEYDNAAGQRVGVFTEALLDALEASGSRDLPWRTIMLRVKELVNVKFPQQHPQADGLYHRLPFSLQEKSSAALLLKTDANGSHVLQAGHVEGVRVNNTYTVMPFGTEPSDKARQIAEATVTQVGGFQSTVRLAFKHGATSLPPDGAIAFPRTVALYKWPAVLPEGADAADLRKELTASRFLQPWSDKGSRNKNKRKKKLGSSTALLQIQQQDHRITLRNDRGVQIAEYHFDELKPPLSIIQAAVRSAETLAKAQHFLNLQDNRQRCEVMQHGLRINFGLVKVHAAGRDKIKPNGRSIKQDGTGIVPEGARIYIDLQNKDSHSTIYVTVFDVQVNGEISLLSKVSATGIELKEGERFTLGRTAAHPNGLLTSWPGGVPNNQPVEEILVMVVTNTAVDLQYVQSDTPLSGGAEQRKGGDDRPLSSLESLAYALSCGVGRRIEAEETSSAILYDVINIPFLLQPSSPAPASKHATATVDMPRDYVPAADLPEPEMTPEWSSLVASSDAAQVEPAQVEPAPKGLLSALVRTVKQTPSCVWVVNKHTEEITVVVSRYRPGRMLSSIGLNLSNIGVGFDLSTTTFPTPAVKKTLAPCQPEGGGNPAASRACFPFWSRLDGFGVISIFVGVDKTAFIENDKVQVGTTVYFENMPDLRMEKHASQRPSSTDEAKEDGEDSASMSR